MNELTVVVGGGARFVVSPLGPEDDGRLDELVRFHQELSPTSAQRRFFSGATQHLAHERLREIVGPAPGDVLLAAWDADGRIAGAAHAIDDPARPAAVELAIAVADRWQQQGLGTALLDQLVRVTAGAGIRHAVGHVQSENRPARSLIASVAARIGDGTGVEWWVDEPGVLGFSFAMADVVRPARAA